MASSGQSVMLDAVSFSSTTYSGALATDAKASTLSQIAARRDLSSAFLRDAEPTNAPDNFEEGSIHSGAESIDDYISDVDVNGSLLEQSLEMQTDMLERHETQQQARNMELFQQLRTWQTEERERLLREHEQQLLRLQAEQQVTEARLAAQRQNQWQPARTAPIRSVIAKQISPRLKSTAGLPQAIASSTLALARIRLQQSLSATDVLQDSTCGPVVHGRPLPQMSTDPNVDHAEELSDVELDSDDAVSYQSYNKNSHCQDDGVYPLPDSASEASDLQSFLQPAASGTVSNGITRTLPPSSSKSEVVLQSKREPQLRANYRHSSESGNSREDGEVSGNDDSDHAGVDNFDELPVRGIAVQGRTFQDLLEEQLRKQQVQQPSVEVSAPPTKTRCRFLRRGEGTARFKTAPRRAQRKSVGNQNAPSSSRNAVAKTAPSNAKPPLPSGAKETLALNHQRQKSEDKKLDKKESSPAISASSQTQKVISVPSSVSVGPVSSTPDPKRAGSSAFRSSEMQASCMQPPEHDSIGEASYIECMEARATKDEAEVVELNEFELLEQYVDDNASLISNMSSVGRLRPFVNNTIQRKVSEGIQGPAKAVPKPAGGNGSKDEGVSDVDDANDDGDVNDTLVEEAALNSRDVQTNRETSPNAGQPTPLQSIYRKILSSSFKPAAIVDSPQPARSNKAAAAAVAFDANGSFEESFESETSDSDDQEEDDDLKKCNVHQLVDMVTNDRQILGPATKETATQNSGATSHEDQVQKMNGVRFQDEQEWHDSSLLAPSDAKNHKRLSDSGIQQSTDNVARGSELPAEVENGSPPTSKLAAKLFPKLKPQNGSKAALEKMNAANQGQTNDAIASAAQSAALREKLSQLESEIQRFRSENAALSELRKEREQVVDRLKREMVEFEKQKADELSRLEDFKAEEVRKLRKERKVFEQYQKAVKAGPDKKEREEIESLKSQLGRLQDDMQKKEQRWTANTQRLRDRIEQLEQENSELKQEIHVLEQRRLDEWKAPRKNEPTDLVPRTDSNTRRSYEQMQKPVVLEQQPLPSQSSLENVSRPKTTVRNPSAPSVVRSKSETTTAAKNALPPASAPATNIKLVPIQALKSPVEDGSEVARQRSLIPVPQTSSPLTTSLDNGSGDATHFTSVVRKTAAKPTIIPTDLDLSGKPYDEVRHPDGKVERICPDGSREILFGNGTRKQISADGQSIIVSFFNGDIKQILPDGRVVYYYADAQTMHTTYSDGLQIFQFSNQQIEKHYIDGTKEIQFPDQTIKYLFPNGSCESIFPDGTVIRVEVNGEEQLTFPNGQKEIHTKHFKRREYPDGTTKTVYSDGRQETRYSNGRVRVKDADGRVIVDQLA